VAKRESGVDEVLGEYVRLAIDHGQYSEAGDSRRANRLNARLIKQFRRVRELSAREKLLPLMQHPDASVRLWAAIHCLNVDSNSALAVLRELARGKGVIAIDARTYAVEWPRGNLPPIVGDEDD
jgi:hypothetical protein